MTLLLIGCGRDCILALSDRMESVDQSDPDEVTKYYLSDAGDVYMALAGNAETAENLPSEVRRRRPSGADVFREIDRISAGLFARQLTGRVGGHLIVSDGGEFKVYGITVASGIAAYYQRTNIILAEGDLRAVAIYKRLARDIPMSDMPCETAARCLHTMAGYIAETVESVGEYDQYGFDMVVFPKSGDVMEYRRRTDAMGSIRARFEASGKGPLFGPNEVT